jgi:anti-sigma factor RsiW
MNCETWISRLDAYVDSELDGSELKQFDEHLRCCAECARLALARTQMKHAVRSAAAGRFDPPAGFETRVRASLPLRGRTSLWRPVLALAVVALLAVSASLAALRWQARQQELAQLVDVHIATLASASPVDVVSTDRHTVKPWFQGRLPFTFNLPELGGTQFTLRGGRMVYLDGAPGAQLLFELNHHEFSVFIAQAGTVRSALVSGPGREKGFSVECWNAGGLWYAVVSDAGAAEVHVLAEKIRAAAQS